jgi:hypothetical protein
MYDAGQRFAMDVKGWDEKLQPQIEAWNYVGNHVMGLVPKAGRKLDSFRFKVRNVPEK